VPAAVITAVVLAFCGWALLGPLAVAAAVWVAPAVRAVRFPRPARARDFSGGGDFPGTGAALGAVRSPAVPPAAPAGGTKIRIMARTWNVRPPE
jgi:hypothetical protein